MKKTWNHPNFGELPLPYVEAEMGNKGGINWGKLALGSLVALLVLNEIKYFGQQQQSRLPTALPPPPMPATPPLLMDQQQRAMMDSALSISKGPPLPLPTAQQIKEMIGRLNSNPNGTSTAAANVYTPPVDESLARIVEHPAVVLIVGGRGSGKSAMAVRLQELLRQKANPYAIGLPPKAGKILPPWYGLAEDFSTIPNNSIVYLPESYRMFHARSSQSAQGRAIGEIVNLSRQRKHTLLFDVQNPAHLDRNILSEVDLVLIKEPGPFQQGFERSQFRSSMDGARAAFAGIGKQRRKGAVWVVAPGAGITGQLMENLIPTFWSDSLSRIFADVPIGSAEAQAVATKRTSGPQLATTRKGQRTPLNDRRATAKNMCEAGHSYREIGKTLGCSVSTAFRMVNG